MMNLFHIDLDFLKESRIIEWAYTEELEPRTYQNYLEWVDKGMSGPLKYLTDHRKDKRKSLSEVYPECESVLVFLFDYRAAKKYLLDQKIENKIAAYTIGFDDEDYHVWIRNKLVAIGSKLQEKFLDLDFKLSLDIHPVLERDLAERAGLGWFGKNSMIISQEFGSYHLIGSLLLNQKLELQTKNQIVDHCGTCTRCIDACPTDAIIPGKRTLDASKCISTFTIELFKDSTPPAGYPANSQEVFGCDICQEVCPWNNKPLNLIKSSDKSLLVDFFNRDLNVICDDINKMSNREFKLFFQNTSFERVGKQGLLKNLKYYLER